MSQLHKIPLTPRQRAGSLLWGIASLIFGWTLFVYWWSKVVRTDQPRPLITLVLAIALFSAVTLLAALLWIRHNQRLARGGKRGMASRYHAPKFEHDALGRTIVLPNGGQVQAADVVVIASFAQLKTYTPEHDAAG